VVFCLFDLFRQKPVPGFTPLSVRAVSMCSLGFRDFEGCSWVALSLSGAFVPPLLRSGSWCVL